MQINREELFQIIDFYKSFKEYSKFSRMELFSHILPAFNFNQYKIYYDNDKIIGYCSWCFLDDLTKIETKKHLEQYMTSVENFYTTLKKHYPALAEKLVNEFKE